MNDLKAGFEKTFKHLQEQYKKLQTGRANVAMVDNLMVDSYGTMAPLKTVANISAPDAMTLRIEPWDKSQIASIEKGIISSDLGFNPQGMGTYVLINVPPMTEERRKKLVKVVHDEAEQARISVRSVRQEAIKAVKNQHDAKEISDDMLRDAEADIQEAVDAMNKQIEMAMKTKETEILKV